MDQNFSEIQYDVTKKSKLKKIYDSNKILIFSLLIILIFALGSVTFYFDSKEKKKITLSENYIKSRIYIENGEKIKAKNILKDIVFENDETYSTLSLFLILNQNLITDPNELLSLFNHVLESNKLQNELKNLLIYKKALIQSDFANEIELLEVIKPLINQETLWKPHALLLIGDYFVSKKEYTKAKEFYLQILSLKDLHRELYNETRSKLALIAND